MPGPRLAVLALVALLAGCGGAAGPAASDRTPTTAGVTSTSTSSSTTTSTTTLVSTPPTTAAPPPPTTPPPSTEAPAAPGAGSLAGRTIVIDPGHNGQNGAHAEEIGRPVDAGGLTKACNTTGTGAGDLSESEVVWDIALRLRAGLEAAGARVVLTRPDDDGWGPCVDERGRAAAEAGAEVLVSIHADGAAPGGHGFHVNTSPSSGPGSEPLGVAVRDALVADGLTPSTYVGDAGLVSRTDLGTLNLATTAAAVLVECGNMANPDDLALLGGDEGRQRLAEDLAGGVTAFLTAG